MGPTIEGNTVEVILTIIAMGFWILFPIGMFLSVSHVDKNTDQIVRLEHLRHDSVDENRVAQPVYQKKETIPFDWHHPIHFFRDRFIHH